MVFRPHCEGDIAVKCGNAGKPDYGDAADFLRTDASKTKLAYSPDYGMLSTATLGWQRRHALFWQSGDAMTGERSPLGNLA